MRAEDVVIRPIVTEKSHAMMAEGKYTFRVATDATKGDIRRAVEILFKVPVTDVKTVNMKGKLRRQGRTQGYRPDWKKAIVTVQSGKTIEFFEGV